jgi:hypothetical protein
MWLVTVMDDSPLGVVNNGPSGRADGFGPRCCEHCGRDLKGRKERFCSDACRMRQRRSRQTLRMTLHLNATEHHLAALKDLVLPSPQSRGGESELGVCQFSPEGRNDEQE